MDIYFLKTEQDCRLYMPEIKNEINGIIGKIISYVRQVAYRILPNGKNTDSAYILKNTSNAKTINVNYDSSLQKDHVEKAYQEIVYKAVDQHKKSITFNSALMALSLPVPIPFISMFFAYRIADSYRTMEKTKSAIERTVFIPSEQYSGLEQIVNNQKN